MYTLSSVRCRRLELRHEVLTEREAREVILRFIDAQCNKRSPLVYTNDINLNLGNGRSLSVFNDLNNKAYCTDIITLSGVIYTNNSNVINY